MTDEEPVGNATYGELMERAVQHANSAWTHLSENHPSDDLHVRQTVLTFRELVYAVAVLARLHLRSVPSPTNMPMRAAGDPRLQAAVRFTDTLDSAIPGLREAFDHDEVGGAAVDLREAVVAVRAATELLATHLSDTGQWRSPESAALDDTTVRLAALDSLAALAIELADVQPLVQKFASSAGVAPEWIHRNGLPGLRGVRETAGELRSLLWPPQDPVVIGAATIANPGIRLGEPLTELSDRVARMQLSAWRAAAYPGREGGIPALIDFATTAVMIHGRAAIAAARIAGTQVRDPSAPQLVKDLLTRADSWREARSQVAVLNSASLPDPVVMEDVGAVRRLLEQLTFDFALHQLPGGEGVTFAPGGQPEHLIAGLTSAAGAFSRIAEWNSITINHLSKSGLLYLPGRLLTGEEMSDHPDLVTAKFVRTSVLAPRGRVRALLTAYSKVSEQPALQIPNPLQSPESTLPSDISPGL